MTRKLLDDWRVAKRDLAPRQQGAELGAAPTTPPDVAGGAMLPQSASTPHTRKVAIITSAMAEPVMKRIAGDIRRTTGQDVRVVPVINQFFGPLVTVAGLICGQDALDTIATACADLDEGDLLLMPRVMLDTAGTRFLDDITVADFRAQVRPQVIFAKTAEELRDALSSSPGGRAHPVVAALPSTMETHEVATTTAVGL